MITDILPGAPKVFALGKPMINTIFDSLVQITEKVDGSQFSFGYVNRQFQMRSKNKQIFEVGENAMFDAAVLSCQRMWQETSGYHFDELHPEYDNLIFHCEYLNSLKHNVLKYARLPKNNLVLFGVTDLKNKGQAIDLYSEFEEYADELDIDVVPLIGQDVTLQMLQDKPLDALDELLKTESFLGGVTIEGIVAKNYEQKVLFVGAIFPMCGKFVSEEFKETLHKEWKTDKNKLDLLIDSFNSEARWLKAVQRRRDDGDLVNDVQDIGPLIKIVQEDITEEEEEWFKQEIFKIMKDKIRRAGVAGFAEWYKRRLIEQTGDNDNEINSIT